MRFETPNFMPGTFNFTALDFNDFGPWQSQIWGPSTVSLTNLPVSAGGYYDGSFTGNFKDHNGVVHAVSGSFHIRRRA